MVRRHASVPASATTFLIQNISRDVCLSVGIYIRTHTETYKRMCVYRLHLLYQERMQTLRARTVMYLQIVKSMSGRSVTSGLASIKLGSSLEYNESACYTAKGIMDAKPLGTMSGHVFNNM